MAASSASSCACSCFVGTQPREGGGAGFWRCEGVVAVVAPTPLWEAVVVVSSRAAALAAAALAGILVLVDDCGGGAAAVAMRSLNGGLTKSGASAELLRRVQGGRGAPFAARCDVAPAHEALKWNDATSMWYVVEIRESSLRRAAHPHARLRSWQ